MLFRIHPGLFETGAGLSGNSPSLFETGESSARTRDMPDTTTMGNSKSSASAASRSSGWLLQYYVHVWQCCISERENGLLLVVVEEESRKTESGAKRWWRRCSRMRELVARHHQPRVLIAFSHHLASQFDTSFSQRPSNGRNSTQIILNQKQQKQY